MYDIEHGVPKMRRARSTAGSRLACTEPSVRYGALRFLNRAIFLHVDTGFVLLAGEAHHAFLTFQSHSIPSLLNSLLNYIYHFRADHFLSTYPMFDMQGLDIKGIRGLWPEILQSRCFE